MSSARPWWASDGPVEGGIDPGEDPLDAHREARRGTRPQPDADDDPASASAHARAAHAPHAGPASEVCSVCPICVGARMLGESRPELLGHLVEAGRHLTAAMRTLLEPDAADAHRRHPGPHPPGRDPASERRDVRRIDLD